MCLLVFVAFYHCFCGSIDGNPAFPQFSDSRQGRRDRSDKKKLRKLGNDGVAHLDETAHENIELQPPPFPTLSASVQSHLNLRRKQKCLVGFRRASSPCRLQIYRRRAVNLWMLRSTLRRAMNLRRLIFAIKFHGTLDARSDDWGPTGSSLRPRNFPTFQLFAPPSRCQ